MNILFVCSAKAWGGNEKWTAMSMKALSRENNLFFVGKKAHLKERFGESIPQNYLPFFSYFDLYTYLKLRRFIKRHKIDVVVSTKKKEYFFCGLITRELGLKHLMRLGVVRNMGIPLWHKLNYHILNDGLIVNAHEIKRNLLRYGFMKAHKINVLYNGLPGLNGGEVADHKPQDISAPFHMVGVGRLTFLKGFQIVIEALAKINQRFPNSVRLTLVGSGRNDEALQTLAKDLGVQEQVAFAGYLERPLEVVKRADLFALPSGNEGIANAALEAMGCGVPVMVTRVGGMGEFIKHGHNGFIVDRNVEAVTTLLEQLMNERLQLPGVGARGKTTVGELFAYDVFEREILSLFEELKVEG